MPSTASRSKSKISYLVDPTTSVTNPKRVSQKSKSKKPRIHRKRQRKTNNTSTFVNNAKTVEEMTNLMPSATLASGDIVDLNLSWDILAQLEPYVTSDYKNEFSGTFVTGEEDSPSEDNNKHTTHVHTQKCMTTEEVACLATATITKGQNDSAQFFHQIPYTYHTHPKFYYAHYDVQIAPPSGEDIGVFLRGCVESKTCFHLVLCCEGIYIMHANPCFIRQARQLLREDSERREMDFALYNISIIGAEILGMETHNYRNSWSVDQWLQWIKGRFVCNTIQTKSYEQEIRQKYDHFCSSCPELDENIKVFENIFKNVVEQTFQLSQCAATNTVSKSKWTQGNWVDVEFVSWEDAKAKGHIHISYVNP